MRGRTSNALMKHIRDNHQISIIGSKQKRELLYMGYYHGYKRYKFSKNCKSKLPISDFSQIKALFDFDNCLKQLFYPIIMEFETIMKNITIEVLVSNSESDIEYIINNKLTNYNGYKPGSKEHKNAIKKYLGVKSKINGTISDGYEREMPVINHFFQNSKPIPLWAVFELVTMGVFADFVKSLSDGDRIEIASRVGIYDPVNDPKAILLPKHIYLLKDLRNSIAHNSTIFDCAFVKFSIPTKMQTDLEVKTGVSNLNFNSIIDYLFLVIYYQKKFKKSKTEMRKIINTFENITEDLYAKISNTSIYFSVLGSDVKTKLQGLKKYV